MKKRIFRTIPEEKERGESQELKGKRRPWRVCFQLLRCAMARVDSFMWRIVTGITSNK